MWERVRGAWGTQGEKVDGEGVLGTEGRRGLSSFTITVLWTQSWTLYWSLPWRPQHVTSRVYRAADGYFSTPVSLSVCPIICLYVCLSLFLSVGVSVSVRAWTLYVSPQGYPRHAPNRSTTWSACNACLATSQPFLLVSFSVCLSICLSLLHAQIDILLFLQGNPGVQYIGRALSLSLGASGCLSVWQSASLSV